MKISEYSLKNSFVIKQEDGNILKFGDGRTIVYGDRESVEEYMIIGDGAISVFDLDKKEKQEAIESIEFHCS